LSKKKPEIKMVDLKKYYKFEVCNPIKEQIKEIEVCGPKIEVQPCNPIDDIKCLPDIVCNPITGPCIPDDICIPQGCLPSLTCFPRTGPCIPEVLCRPQVGPCQPWVFDPTRKLDELVKQVEIITKEIEEIKRKLK
jgi:hypothetical protein